MQFDFERSHLPGVYHQAPDTVSVLPKETDEDEPDQINKGIASLGVQCIDKKDRAPNMFLSQDTSLI